MLTIILHTITTNTHLSHVAGSNYGMRICFVCAVICHSRCQNCEAVYYCSRTCQSSHWKSHIKVIDTKISYFLFFSFFLSLFLPSFPDICRSLFFATIFLVSHSLTHSIAYSLITCPLSFLHLEIFYTLALLFIRLLWPITFNWKLEPLHSKLFYRILYYLFDF